MMTMVSLLSSLVVVVVAMRLRELNINGGH